MFSKLKMKHLIPITAFVVYLVILVAYIGYDDYAKFIVTQVDIPFLDSSQLLNSYKSSGSSISTLNQEYCVDTSFSNVKKILLERFPDAIIGDQYSDDYWYMTENVYHPLLDWLANLFHFENRIIIEVFDSEKEMCQVYYNVSYQWGHA